MYQPPLYYLIAAAILSVCKLSITDPASVSFCVRLGLSFGDRAVRFGVFKFAPSCFLSERARRPFTGSFSADAFVPGALCDERNARRRSGDSDALSLFAPA